MQSMQHNEARKHLRELLMKHSVRWGEFELKSGKKSDFYVDVKQAVLTPYGHTTSAVCLTELLFPGTEAVAGVTLGGCPLASSVSFYSVMRQVFDSKGPFELPALYVRAQAKEHGTKRAIEGTVRPGAQVTLVEDVVTTGGSSMQAAQALREAGFEVLGVIAVVDREEGGAACFREAELGFRSIFTRSDLQGPTG